MIYLHFQLALPHRYRSHERCVSEIRLCIPVQSFLSLQPAFSKELIFFNTSLASFELFAVPLSFQEASENGAVPLFLEVCAPSSCSNCNISAAISSSFCALSPSLLASLAYTGRSHVHCHPSERLRTLNYLWPRVEIVTDIKCPGGMIGYRKRGYAS